MKKLKISIVLILWVSVYFNVLAQTVFAERNLLTTSWSTEDLKKYLPQYGDWKPFPELNDRNTWDTISPMFRDSVLKVARELNGTGYQSVSATAYLNYVRTGRRGGGGGKSRQKLRYLLLAEIFENKGEFVDEIVNGVWAICEETSWVSSAHLHMQEKGVGLPDNTDPIVDLSVGSTVNLLSWVDYFMGERFDSISPLIRERIYQEVNTRMLKPCLTRDDFWWMGNGDYLINNWNPWICSNWLMAVLVFEKDEQRRMESFQKIFTIVDKFINFYPDDGACDEGPSYWYHAGGKLFDFLEILYSASNGQMSIYNQPVIQEIARYPYRVHISGNQFVNFADAGAKSRMVNYNQETLYKFGQRISDTVLMSFAGHFPLSESFLTVIRYKYSMLRVFRYIFTYPDLVNLSHQAPFPETYYFDNSQVLISRDKGGSDKGFFMAAKGGHNNESHNHNDVGNFIVYYDGDPVLVDAGVGTYTAKTFSDERYDIWTMQSQYHNCPTINGIMQKDGKDYKATDVSFVEEDGKVILSLDIAKAYPVNSEVISWKRTITHIKNNSIEVSDVALVNKYIDTTFLSFISVFKPQIKNPGEILLVNKDKGAVTLLFAYDSKRWNAEIEFIPTEDEHLKKAWPNGLYRIKLISIKKHNSIKGKVKITTYPIK